MQKSIISELPVIRSECEARAAASTAGCEIWSGQRKALQRATRIAGAGRPCLRTAEGDTAHLTHTHCSVGRALRPKHYQSARRRHRKTIGRPPHPPQTPASQFKQLYRNGPGQKIPAQSCLVCRGSPDRDLTFINSKQCGRFVPFSHASDQNRGRSILTTRVMRG